MGSKIEVKFPLLHKYIFDKEDDLNLRMQKLKYRQCVNEVSELFRIRSKVVSEERVECVPEAADDDFDDEKTELPQFEQTKSLSGHSDDEVMEHQGSPVDDSGMDEPSYELYEEMDVKVTENLSPDDVTTPEAITTDESLENIMEADQVIVDKSLAMSQVKDVVECHVESMGNMENDSEICDNIVHQIEKCDNISNHTENCENTSNHVEKSNSTASDIEKCDNTTNGSDSFRNENVITETIEEDDHPEVDKIEDTDLLPIVIDHFSMKPEELFDCFSIQHSVSQDPENRKSRATGGLMDPQHESLMCCEIESEIIQKSGQEFPLEPHDGASKPPKKPPRLFLTDEDATAEEAHQFIRDPPTSGNNGSGSSLSKCHKEFNERYDKIYRKSSFRSGDVKNDCKNVEEALGRLKCRRNLGLHALCYAVTENISLLERKKKLWSVWNTSTNNIMKEDISTKNEDIDLNENDKDKNCSNEQTDENYALQDICMQILRKQQEVEARFLQIIEAENLLPVLSPPHVSVVTWADQSPTRVKSRADSVSRSSIPINGKEKNIPVSLEVPQEPADSLSMDNGVIERKITLKNRSLSRFFVGLRKRFARSRNRKSK